MIQTKNMIDTQPLKDNPNLYGFLPFLYVVWADNVLTPNEINVLKSLIENLKWITEKEKLFLIEQLNPSKSPSHLEYQAWLTEIRKVLHPEAINNRESLADIGMKLANHHSTGKLNDGLEPSLQQLQTALGLIDTEAFFNFYP